MSPIGGGASVGLLAPWRGAKGDFLHEQLSRLRPIYFKLETSRTKMEINIYHLCCFCSQNGLTVIIAETWSSAKRFSLGFTHSTLLTDIRTYWLLCSLSSPLCQAASDSWGILPISCQLSGTGLQQPAAGVYEYIVSGWWPTLYIPFVTELHKRFVKMQSARF